MSTTTSTAIEAQGTKQEYNSGTDAAPVWKEITNVTDVSGFDGAANMIDVTNLSSTGKEKRPGLQDWGQVSLALNINLKEPSHAALLVAKQKRARTQFRTTLSDGTAFAYDAYVKNFPVSAKVDQVVSGTVSLEITGDITVTIAQ